MNGGTGRQAWRIFVLWSAVFIFAFLVISPLFALIIAGSADSATNPEITGYNDVYQKKDLRYPFWPLENNIFDELTDEEIDIITGYVDEHRRDSHVAARINFGACKAVFIDRRELIHQIVFCDGNTTGYDLTPTLLAEEETLGESGKPEAGYSIYRIYPEFPAYYNAETPYIDFIDVWTDSSISCIAGDLADARIKGRFYRNTDGRIAQVIDMTDTMKISPLLFSNEKRKSAGPWSYMGTVSFRGEYAVASIPVMPVMNIDSHVTYGIGDDAGVSGFTNTGLIPSFGVIGMFVYILLLVISGQEVFRYLRRRKETVIMAEREEK